MLYGSNGKWTGNVSSFVLKIFLLEKCFNIIKSSIKTTKNVCQIQLQTNKDVGRQEEKCD